VKDGEPVKLEGWSLESYSETAAGRLGGLKDASMWTGTSRKRACWF
jgi:hypothetical protein